MKSKNIYIGNCSKKGIYKYKFKKGKLFFCGNTNDYERCTYLAKYKKIIYGVLEVKNKEDNNNGYLVTYREEKEKLVNIDKKISYGQGPCHVSINAKRKLIFVSNYIDGYFTIFKMNKDGYIGEKIYNNVLDVKKSHMHFLQMSNDNFFLYGIDLGINTIIVYEMKDEIKELARIDLGDKIEPRHLIVDKDLIYVVTESSCRLYTLKFENNTLKILNNQFILPDDVKIKDNYTGCAIKASRRNKYIYISIRGHNSISVFKKKGQDLKLIQNVKCNGDLPRDIELDKHDKYLLVANQDSNNITIYKRNKITGKLKYTDKEEIESPTCIIAK